MALPPEYLDVLAAMKTQHEKWLLIVDRIENTGTADPELYVVNDNMRQLSDRLYEIRKRYGLVD